MAILYDQYGNPFRGFLDTVGDELLTETGRDYSKNLASVNAEVFLDINGAQTATFDVRSGAANLTFVFEGSLDGNNFDIPLQAWTVRSTVGATISSETYVNTVVVATTIAATYTVGATGFKRVKLRVSARTSGDIDVAARASAADLIVYAKPLPSVLHVTATGTSGAAVTATLPSATGLFHCITKIHLIQFVVAARTAAATPVLATTTNLPGTPVYSCDATVGAIGAIFQYDLAPMTGNPLRSLVAGTNTTFVGPATTSTIWRWNISYYLSA